MIRSLGLSIDRHFLLSFGRGTIPKRYLIRSYFEPQVSDRLVSYLQVIPFHVVEGKARVHYDEENYSIGDEYGARTRDLCSDSAVL